MEKRNQLPDRNLVFRIAFLILCVMLLLHLSGMAAEAETVRGKTGSLKWKLSEKGVLTVWGTGKTGDYSEKDDRSDWKPYNDRIKRIVIKEGVTRIGWCAFCNCANLKRVTIADTVTSIELKAFKNCTKLVSVNIPESVTNIGDQAFAGCGGSSDLGQLSFFSGTGFRQFCREGCVVLKVKKGSYGEQYAKDQQLSYSDGKNKVPGLKRQLLDKIDAVVAECIRPKMSDRDKAKALHDWIICHARYGGEAGNLLLTGSGACDSYTWAYSLLLCKAGLANAKAFGTVNRGESHFWNLVCIDGKWYHVDTTFDDPVSTKIRSGHERSRYFMLTDKQIRKDHVWDGDMFDCYDPDQ